jgi:hypothetical protein
LDYSGAAIQRMICDGEFASFDDHFMMERLRKALSQLNAPEDEPLKTKINAVLNRRPPKLVAACERIRARDQRREHHNLVGYIKTNLDRWAEQWGVEKTLWYVWERNLAMTKIGSLVPVSAIEQGGVDEEAAQGVRILTTDPDAANSRSQLLVEYDYALAKHLSVSNLYMIRVYVAAMTMWNGNAVRSDTKFAKTFPTFHSPMSILSYSRLLRAGHDDAVCSYPVAYAHDESQQAKPKQKPIWCGSRDRVGEN